MAETEQKEYPMIYRSITALTSAWVLRTVWQVRLAM